MTDAPALPRSLEHEIRTTATTDAVIAALTTDDGLAAWHGSATTGAGQEDAVEFEHATHPNFTWDVSRDGDTVMWVCRRGPGSSEGTRAVYECVALDDGRVAVRLTHEGWEADDDAFRRCNTYWGALLFQLERYLETGERRPVFA